MTRGRDSAAELAAPHRADSPGGAAAHDYFDSPVRQFHLTASGTEPRPEAPALRGSEESSTNCLTERAPIRRYHAAVSEYPQWAAGPSQNS